MWDTERRYGETRNPDSPRLSLLINRTVFTPRKDPLRLPPVLYNRQKSRGIWYVTAQAAERAVVLETSEVWSVLTAKVVKSKSVAHASR